MRASRGVILWWIDHALSVVVLYGSALYYGGRAYWASRSGSVAEAVYFGCAAVLVFSLFTRDILRRWPKWPYPSDPRSRSAAARTGE